jgi:hypothetical protein
LYSILYCVIAELPLYCGGDHDRLTTVGAIGIAERFTGGSGTVAACASYPIRNKRHDDRIIVIRIGIFDCFFVMLFLLV